jgi:hypothetical protein
MVAALLTTVASARGTERAAARTSSLSWIRLPGAETCVSTQDLARDVEQRLGHPIFVSPSEADVSVEGHIEQNGGAPGWHAVLVLRDANGASLGTRELRRADASCDTMRAPLALVIVVMIDPEAALRGHETPAPPPPPPQPVVIEKLVPVLVRVPEPAPPGPPAAWHLDTGGSLIGSVGLLPGPGIGPFGGGILVPPRQFFGAEVYGAAWLDQNVSAGSGSATFWFGYVGGGLCPLILRGHRFDGFGCASGQLGYLASYGPSGTPNQAQVHLAGALELRGTLHIAGPFTARAGAMLVVPLIRNQFVYGENAPLFRMAPVAATADLGLGVAFP